MLTKTVLKSLVVKEEIVQEDLRDINREVSLVLDRFEKILNNNLENEQISVGIDGVIVLAKS